MLKRPGSKLIMHQHRRPGRRHAARPATSPRARTAPRRPPGRRHRRPRARTCACSNGRVPEDADIDDARSRQDRRTPPRWITIDGLREQREAVPELAYRRYHCEPVDRTRGALAARRRLASLRRHARVHAGRGRLGRRRRRRRTLSHRRRLGQRRPARRRRHLPRRRRRPRLRRPGRASSPARYNVARSSSTRGGSGRPHRSSSARHPRHRVPAVRRADDPRRRPPLRRDRRAAARPPRPRRTTPARSRRSRTPLTPRLAHRQAQPRATTSTRVIALVHGARRSRATSPHPSSSSDGSRPNAASAAAAHHAPARYCPALPTQRRPAYNTPPNARARATIAAQPTLRTMRRHHDLTADHVTPLAAAATHSGRSASSADRATVADAYDHATQTRS